MLSAYLLVSHGSSDSRHQAGLTRVASVIRQQLDRTLPDGQATATTSFRGSSSRRIRSERPASSYPLAGMTASATWTLARSQRVFYPTAPLVGTATLEATAIPLAQQIEVFARRAMAQGIQQVVIVPLFLLAGVHVKEDLPREITAAQQQLPSHLRLLCTPYLSSHTSFRRFVAGRLQASAAEHCLLVAHGSRRPGGNRSVKQLGSMLGAEVAFWSVPPDLETQVMALMQRGYQHIAIAPYFLFPGGITDAITHQTEALAEQLPQLSLRLLPPLGTSLDFGYAVTEIVRSIPHAVPMQSWERDHWPMVRNGITA